MPNDTSLANVDLVLFDFDGTIVDSCEDIAACANRVLASRGHASLPSERIRGFIGDGAHELLARCLRASGEDPDAATIAEATAAFEADYLEHPADHTTVYPGVREFLESRHGRLPMALVTNKPLGITLTVLRAVGLAGAFDPILGERSLPTHKPDPAPLAFAMALHGVPAERTIMVGDGPQDIAAGRAAGVRTVAALYGLNEAAVLERAEPDVSLTYFAELVRALD